MITTRTEDILRDIQLAVIGTLAGADLFDDVAQFDVLPGETQSIADAARAGQMEAASGKQGLAVLIHPPDIARMIDASGGLGLPVAEIRLEVFSHYETNFGSNGPHIHPASMAWRLFDTLVNRRFGWLKNTLLITTEQPIQVDKTHEDTGDANYNVTLRFYCPAGYQCRVANPVETDVSTGVASFYCATADASLYYTTAPLGSAPDFPTPETGTLITGNITFETAVEGLVAAYKAGMPPSEVIAFYMDAAPNDAPFTTEDDEELHTEDDRTLVIEL